MAISIQELSFLNPHMAPSGVEGFQFVSGGITAAPGFLASGLHAGIKKKKKDLAMIASVQPAVAGAVFTTNTVKAAPVLWNQQALNSGNSVCGVVVNSGNANACTGATGMIHARQMAEMTSQCLQCQPEEILVASTGVIGVPLPIETVLAGIAQAADTLESDLPAGAQAAEAILTTDTFTKEVAVQFELDGTTVTLGAMAKGSGMIHPNMATMLAFITTDANISQPLLQQALRESVDESYHMISVDGDTSTNDMVVVLANGLANHPPITTEDENYVKFRQALSLVNIQLAQAIANDGEGATKFLTVTVQNAPSKVLAQKLAKSVISSSLVKSAAYGEDANWGRVLAAMGATGECFNPDCVSLSIQSEKGRISMLEDGQPVSFSEELAKCVLQEKAIEFRIDLQAGAESAVAWGCDLSHEYVSINSSYRS